MLAAPGLERPVFMTFLFLVMKTIWVKQIAVGST